MIRVYHTAIRPDIPSDRRFRISALFVLPDAPECETIWRGDHPNLHYQLVAEIEGTDLEKAFELTNSIDHYWGVNKGLKVCGNQRYRSTSVGDVVQDTDTGTVYMVTGVGFQALNVLTKEPDPCLPAPTTQEQGNG